MFKLNKTTENGRKVYGIQCDRLVYIALLPISIPLSLLFMALTLSVNLPLLFSYDKTPKRLRRAMYLFNYGYILFSSLTMLGTAIGMRGAAISKRLYFTVLGGKYSSKRWDKYSNLHETGHCYYNHPYKSIHAAVRYGMRNNIYVSLNTLGMEQDADVFACKRMPDLIDKRDNSRDSFGKYYICNHLGYNAIGLPSIGVTGEEYSRMLADRLGIRLGLSYAISRATACLFKSTTDIEIIDANYIEAE